MIMELGGIDQGTWIAIANGFAGVAVLLVIKPLNDVRREVAKLNVTLYKDFVTYERLQEIQSRQVRPSRRQNT